MANYAVIQNGFISNIIVADTQEIAEAVTNLVCIKINNEPGDPGIGWSYDGTNFTAPVIETPEEETPEEETPTEETPA
jgi:hypothetical protein